MQFLITAGATRNPIDAVRYLSARSSGRTGVFLAERLHAAGHEVGLLGSAEALLRTSLVGEEYGSTRDLMARMERAVRERPDVALIHACAVGDYEMAGESTSKIESGRDELVLRMRPTPKIADHVREWGHRGLYVTFKAASPGTCDEELVQIAEAQLARTGSDFVFANVLGRLGERVAIIGGHGARWFDDRKMALESLLGVLGV